MNFSKSFFNKKFFNAKSSFKFLNYNNGLTKLKINFSNKYHLTRMFYLNRINNILLTNVGISMFQQFREEGQNLLEDTEGATLTLSLDNFSLMFGRSLTLSNGKV
jgi:hypothetical protein